MNAAASIVLLDSTTTKLIHSFSWGLPQSYLRKGIIDPQKSLAEVITKEPVVIFDASKDGRIQYPELATKAGIASILGVPIITDEVAIGSIRVYTKHNIEFSSQDISFVNTMANLAAAAIKRNIILQEKEQVQQGQGKFGTAVLRQTRSANFAHPSEEEFAQILDFYNLDWVYEPRSFPLAWDQGRVTEMFTPDFYLPGLDLYIELTTLKQSLVTEKNRKLRRLRMLYPEVNITLLLKKDYDRLLAKFGYGPLAQDRGHGVGEVLYSSAEIQRKVREIAKKISNDYANRHPVMVGVLRGVFCFMSDLIRHITIPIDIDFMAISYYGGKGSSVVKITKDIDIDVSDRTVIMVEDIVDTGLTLNYIINHLQAKGVSDLAVCTLLDKRARRIVDVPLDYIGFEIPDEFVVGYGLDYKEEYRNLPFISVLSKKKKLEKGEARRKA
jgi:hypoxanthine phosphoribosyltransferase